MKNVIVACDSFKGSMTAGEVCSIIKSAIEKKYPSLNVISIPVADGGEGTVDAYIAALGGEKVYENVISPQGKCVKAYWGRLSQQRAVIECAQASGITVDDNKNALTASSYGTGQLISAALDSGARSLIIGLGGSATTDGGAGLLSALGARFLNEKHELIRNGGIGLTELYEIDVSQLDKRLQSVEITVLCDVTNPLYGKNGAAYVYAPQKGAGSDDVELLDSGLIRLAQVCENQGFSSCADRPGSGAAGGMGFCFMCFTKAKTVRGIDSILDITDFEEKSEDAVSVITGEGKLDVQSLFGKVPFGVVSRSRAKRNIAVVGAFDADIDKVKELGIDEVYSTNPDKLPFEKVLPTCREDLYNVAYSIKF